MVLENGTVREVRLPGIGLTLKYPAHNEGRRAAPQEALAAQVTPIIAVGFGRRTARDAQRASPPLALALCDSPADAKIP